MTETGNEYGQFMRDLLARAGKARQPSHGTFELTSRCNLSCGMCYVRSNAGNMAERRKELPASAWLDLARQARENGMVFLLLTGGELFLRPDFFEIYEPLTRMGLMLTLFTNGTLVTKEIAKRLAQAPPSLTEITLYGATAATYEAVTGVPGSFSSCCSGIEALVSHRVPLGLKTTITRNNVHELAAMRQMAHDWGVPFSGGCLLSKRPDGKSSDVEKHRLSPAECVALDAGHRTSAHEATEALLKEPAAVDHDNFYCEAGKAVFAVTPSGEMNICLVIPQPSARTLDIGFQLAWKQVRDYVDSVPPASRVCLSCGARAYCGRCPAWSLSETGTLTEPVPYLCDIAWATRESHEQPA
jgi:radical SAM protein with 4Fe4S-binding SPASM domain